MARSKDAERGRGRGGIRGDSSLPHMAAMVAPDVNTPLLTLPHSPTHSQTYAQVSSGSGAAPNCDSNDLCGTCNTKTGLDAIGCDKCPKWFHPTPMCVGLPPPLILSIQEYGGSGINFECTECRAGNNKGGGIGAGAFQQLFLTVRMLCESVQALTAQVSSLHAQGNATGTLSLPASGPASTAGSDSEQMRSLIREEAREMEERRKRKCSIIVRGVEADSVPTFKPAFDRVCNHLVGSVIPVTNVVCINKDRRLFRANILDDETRKNLLDNARSLRDSQFSNVFINRDLTYKQRQELKARRDNRRNGQTGPPSQPSDSTVNAQATAANGSNVVPPPVGNALNH